MDNVNTINETINGTVEHITYHNTENGFTVLKLKTDDDILTVVGTMPFVRTGDVLNVTGSFGVHATFGRQFKATAFEKEMPSNSAAILRYLSSGAVKGIGPITAGKLVELFGEETLNVIENDHIQLTRIKGISKEKAENIRDEYIKQFGMRDLLMLLSRFKVSPEQSLKVYKALGKNSEEIIKDNPYVLCTDTVGFAFEKAEEIAEYYNVSKENTNRIEAGIIYVLRANISNGHTCLPKDKLLQVSANLLDTDVKTVEDSYYALVDSFNLFEKELDENIFVFLPDYYNAERYIAARLCAANKNVSHLLPLSDLEVDYVQNKLSVKFELNQRRAILSAVENGALVLTGGPGTGKTTILNAIIKILESRGLSIALAAPTGRAAKRMMQLTGYEAKTIHRLLEATKSNEEKTYFARNESNPLSCDVLIIDEMSMVDTLLFESILRALPLSARIILVGDSDQLPSVGAGNVLLDIIESDILPSIKLQKVFRQAEQSAIVVNAHRIINKKQIDLTTRPDSDFFFLERKSSDNALKTTLDLCLDRLPKAYGFSPFDDIQVLCPSKKGELGGLNLNTVLQRQLNPGEPGQAKVYSKGTYFTVGDKVMQIKNNYDIEWTSKTESGFGVFNGDIGIIESINAASETLVVCFDDKRAEYTKENILELELAYAITVHKSQGSEFDCVILPILDVPSKLKYTNLIYTAVTRAKKLLVIVGRSDILYQMVENDRKTKRFTFLKEFIDSNREKN